MRLFEKVSHLRFAMLLGATAGMAVGCTVTFVDSSPTECGGLGSHSEETGDGECVCDAGYEWCNPGNDDDFSCCEYQEPCVSGENNHVDDGGNCECDAGYTWCNPDDTSDLSCCEISSDSGTEADDSTSGDGDGDSGTDTGTDTGVLPPDDCTPDEEGSFWCTHTDSMGPIGSQTFECVDGMWVENPGWPDLDCTSSDFDFGVGCVFNETEMQYESVCEYGPGDACELDSYEPNCDDTDLLLECFYTKVKSTSCQNFCETVGIDGITYEMGICEVVDGMADCSCFDP